MKKLIILTLSLILFASCASKIVETALKKAGATDKKTVLKKIDYPNKDIVFLEMIHLGQKEFYDDVKDKVDSLTNENYHVFYEGLYLRKSDRIIAENDSVSYLKFRKLLGVDPLTEYTKIKPFSSFVEDYNLVDQPDYVDLGLTEINSEPIDISAVEQIKLYESLREEIKLDDCDFKNKLGESGYDCDKLSKSERNFFIEEIALNKRNEHIFNSIKTSNKDKILIIYGKKHLEGLQELMNEEIQ